MPPISTPKLTFEDHATALNESVASAIRQHFSLPADFDLTLLADRAHVITLAVRPVDIDDDEDDDPALYEYIEGPRPRLPYPLCEFEHLYANLLQDLVAREARDLIELVFSISDGRVDGILPQVRFREGVPSGALPFMIASRIEDGRRFHLMKALVILPENDGGKALEILERLTGFCFGVMLGVIECSMEPLASEKRSIPEVLGQLLEQQCQASANGKAEPPRFVICSSAPPTT